MNTFGLGSKEIGRKLRILRRKVPLKFDCLIWNSEKSTFWRRKKCCRTRGSKWMSRRNIKRGKSSSTFNVYQTITP